jgi:hypothetical protein
MLPVHCDATEQVLERIFPVKSYEHRLTGLVHLARPGWSTANYCIVCEGEDTALAWERVWADTVPTCMWCIAGILRVPA